MLKAPTPIQIEAAVWKRIREALEERFGEVRGFRGADKLNSTLGLSSLDLALIVAELEAELGVDPFAKLVPITSVRSVDDLVEAYRKAFLPEAKETTPDQNLARAVQRARIRRTRKERT
jgi:acyl carrier protein